MQLLDALETCFDETEARIAKVDADQMSNPTPCSEWDVKALLEHTVGTTGFFGTVAAGTERGEPPADLLGDDPAATFATIASGTLAAWRERGLDGMVTINGNEMPAEMAATINLLDTYVHAWDLAKATGQDPTLDDDIATMIYERSQPLFPNARANGFADEVDLGGGASPTDRCVAFLGRTP